MISLLALCLGRYTISTLILLYKAMFIPALIFNCQACSHITQTNVLLLERLQLVEVPQANPMVANVNTEHLHQYGILPIGDEIQKRRMVFIYPPCVN